MNRWAIVGRPWRDFGKLVDFVRRKLQFRCLADIQSGRGLQPLRDDHKPLIDFREQRE